MGLRERSPDAQRGFACRPPGTGAGVLLLYLVNKKFFARKPGKEKNKYLPALEQEAARGASGFVGAVRSTREIKRSTSLQHFGLMKWEFEVSLSPENGHGSVKVPSRRLAWKKICCGGMLGVQNTKWIGT